jgi:GMP synthase (glutamine-hydrolysing)
VTYRLQAGSRATENARDDQSGTQLLALGETPPNLDGFSGVISLGGAANPLEQARYPWLAREQVPIRQALSKRVPLLGVCLGAEIIAYVIDGSTRRLSEPEIGWLAITATEEAAGDQLWSELPERIHGYEWHSYGFGTPLGAVALAVGGASLQAFRFGARVWGVQFHIDDDETTIADWIGLYERELLEAGAIQQNSLDQPRVTSANPIDSPIFLGTRLVSSCSSGPTIWRKLSSRKPSSELRAFDRSSKAHRAARARA